MSGSPNTQKMKEKIRLIMEKCAQREDLEKIRKITIGGLELYRTTAYTRKSDSTRVLAYYDMQQGIGFRVELKEQIEVIEMKKRKKKTVKIEDAERKEKQDTSQAIRQAKPGRETLKAAMQDSLVKLNYQTMIDATAEIFGAPVVKRRFTKEEISIPILYMDGRYRTVTSLLREISTIFYPEINGAKCTIHDSRRETFIDRKSGRVVRGRFRIPENLRIQRERRDVDRILDVIEFVAGIVGVEPEKLFLGIARSYLQVSSEAILLILKAGERWRFPRSPSAIYKMSRLPQEIIDRCIEATSIRTIVRKGNLVLEFVGLDNTKVRLNVRRYMRHKGLVLLECVVDIISGTASDAKVDERARPRASRFTIRILFADGEFFRPDFIIYCFSNGILPVIRPWSDVFTKNRDPVLKAYAVFFYRYLWWLYRLRKVVERFFSGMFRRGKLLSFGRGAGYREVGLNVAGRNVFNLATLPDWPGVLERGFITIDL